MLWLWLNISNEDSNATIIKHRSFLKKKGAKKINLDTWFSFALLKSYILIMFKLLAAYLDCDNEKLL